MCLVMLLKVDIDNESDRFSQTHKMIGFREPFKRLTDRGSSSFRDIFYFSLHVVGVPGRGDWPDADGGCRSLNRMQCSTDTAAESSLSR